MTLLETSLFPDQWQSVFTANIQAQPVEPGSNRVRPIGSIGIPVLLQSPLIAVNAQNDEYPPTWRYAGFARQAVDSKLIVGGATNATYAIKSLFLNKLNLFYFPKFTADWALSLDINRWILELNITVFEYVGEINTIPNELDIINAKLDNISNFDN